MSLQPALLAAAETAQAAAVRPRGGAAERGRPARGGGAGGCEAARRRRHAPAVEARRAPTRALCAPPLTRAPLQQSCGVAAAVGRRHRRVAARHRASFAAAAAAPVLTAPLQVLCQHGRARSVAGAAKLRAAGVADVKARAKPPLRCCAGPRFSCADTCRAAGSGGRHRGLLRRGPQRAQVPQVHAKLQVLKPLAGSGESHICTAARLRSELLSMPQLCCLQHKDRT